MRLFITVGVIAAIYVGNIEYKHALSILSLIYLFLHILINYPEEKEISKYISIFIDVSFLTFMIYMTGLPYLAVFILPVFSDFLYSKKDIGIYTILAVIPVGTSLYISNFSDFLFIPLILGGMAGMLKLRQVFIKKEKYFREQKDEMENLYLKNIAYEEKIDQLNRLFSTLESLQKLKDGKLTFQGWLYELNEILSTNGIVFFDFTERKCISAGEIDCNKEILKYITDTIQEFEDSSVNELLNSDYTVSILIENEDSILGILVIAYKFKTEKRDKIYRVILDYLKCYINDKHQNFSLKAIS
ncbi:hypothetical protein [Persephonella sp.]